MKNCTRAGTCTCQSCRTFLARKDGGHCGQHDVGCHMNCVLK